MMDVLRTPDERFDGLPGFPWVPRELTTSDGLRVAAVDEGPRDAVPVLLLHGEPSWSYLYRRMIPPLLHAGFRVVAPDLVGFGRSDKPARVEDHSYARHVEWLRSALFDDLDLRGAVLVGQDWGGLLGLRLVAEHPGRFAAVCLTNTGLPDGSAPLGPEWQRFRAFVERTEPLPVGFLVSRGCRRPVTPEVVAAYDAPFPDASYTAGPKAMPGLVPQSPSDPAVPAQRAAWAALAGFDRPFLLAYSDGDPITAGADEAFLRVVPGTAGQPHTTIRGAGHFVQEDAGEELTAVLLEWLGGLGGSIDRRRPVR